jgi:hypothetical protein
MGFLVLGVEDRKEMATDLSEGVGLYLRKGIENAGALELDISGNATEFLTKVRSVAEGGRRPFGIMLDMNMNYGGDRVSSKAATLRLEKEIEDYATEEEHEGKYLLANCLAGVVWSGLDSGRILDDEGIAAWQTRATQDPEINPAIAISPKSADTGGSDAMNIANFFLYANNLLDAYKGDLDAARKELNALVIFNEDGHKVGYQVDRMLQLPPVEGYIRGLLAAAKDKNR